MKNTIPELTNEFYKASWGGKKLKFHSSGIVVEPASRTLFIADLHLGKAQHFRKSGLGIPAAVGDHNFDKLERILVICKPSKVVILGDLFHSDYNHSWLRFEKTIQSWREISFHLVLGNHDVLERSLYMRSRLRIHDGAWQMGDWLLSHYPLDDIPEGYFNVCGHIHPGIRIRGRGKQGLRLPCFYVQPTQMILPSFGAFTGFSLIKPQKSDQVYALAENRVIPLFPNAQT